MSTALTAGFVAGTLVHTPLGTIPIARLRVGDLVLASGDAEEPPTPHRVTATFVSEPQEVSLLQFVVGTSIHSLVLASAQPFWCEGEGDGWLTVRDADGHHLRPLEGDEEAWMIRALRIFRTQQPDVGWTYQHDPDSGPTVDLRDGAVAVPRSFAEETCDEWAADHTEDFLAPVHAVTVEGAGTLFVGEVGIWVRDAGPHAA